MLLTGNKDTWAENVKSLLLRLNFGTIWKEQEIQREKEFVKELKSRLISEYISFWSESIAGSTRYGFYRMFKFEWGVENYLFALDKKVFRDVYVNFRTGFSELFMHKYRYTPDSHNDMLCPSCYETDESEMHFLLECPVYNDLREKYIGNVSFANREIVIHHLFDTQDVNDIRRLSSFIYYALRRRRDAVTVAMAEEVYYV